MKIISESNRLYIKLDNGEKVQVRQQDEADILEKIGDIKFGEKSFDIPEGFKVEPQPLCPRSGDCECRPDIKHCSKYVRLVPADSAQGQARQMPPPASVPKWRTKAPEKEQVKTAEEILRQCLQEFARSPYTDEEWETIKGDLEVHGSIIKAMELYANQFKKHGD